INHHIGAQTIQHDTYTYQPETNNLLTTTTQTPQSHTKTEYTYNRLDQLNTSTTTDLISGCQTEQHTYQAGINYALQQETETLKNPDCSNPTNETIDYTNSQAGNTTS